MAVVERIEIKPQRGPQERFLCSAADIAIYGGAAGGGKSWTLLFEPLRHINNKDFGAVIFRRTYPQVTNEGGLWDESRKIYPWLRATSSVGGLQWKFPSGAKVTFSHLQREENVTNWQGSQIPLIEWDELTHFTEYQFTYMLSRNRSTCGVRPYVRASCNPNAASWVARWVEWYIDPTTGLPIPERSGKLRYFVRDGETLRWGTRAELAERYPDKAAKSFTFVGAKLSDNKILESKDPAYRANLEALSRVERERLLGGNWLIADTEGEWPPEYFGRHLWFTDWPARDQWSCCVIAWDPSRGGESQFGDYSAFTILVRDLAGNLWADAMLGHWSVEEGVDVGLELSRVFRPDGFVIEVNQFQQLIKVIFLARAKELGISPPVYTIDNRVKKEVRIRRLGSYFANRQIRLKGDSTGARITQEQLMVFPNGEHDDGPDSLEMNLRTMIEIWNGKRKGKK